MVFKCLSYPGAKKALSPKILSNLYILALASFLVGCSINPIPFESVANKAKPKSIFVFLDGTSNNPTIPTNIYRLFEKVKKYNDNQTVATYIPGVGNARESLAEIAGKVAGFGIEERILLGYKFIVQNYQPKTETYPGDRIYIFGFSRGAHTARSLAGLISYAGIPKLADAELDSFNNSITSGFNIGNKILELTKKQIDNKTEWSTWERGESPILASLIKSDVKSMFGSPKNIEVQPAEVEFLGIWDTVPGSQGIDYFETAKKDLVCKQHKESTDKKQRYQVDSYPPIHHIAHAVSKDEKRSEFKPLFLCSTEIDETSVHNKELTKLDEFVFPGAHADVGGGYEHKNYQLPDISLKWMVTLLGQHYSLYTPDFINSKFELNPKSEGLADLSISDKVGSYGSSCINRKLPPSITPHESIETRNKAGAVPWLYFDKKPKNNYPDQSCKDWVNPIAGVEEKNNILCIKQAEITCEDLGY